MAETRELIRCNGGPFNTLAVRVMPNVQYVLVTDGSTGLRAAYALQPGQDGLRLVCDPECMPAWASKDAPMQLTCDGRDVRVWTSNPIGGEGRWVIDAGAGHHTLSYEDVDAATTFQDVERMANAWLKEHAPAQAG